jgi:hypothetical protein
VQALADGAPADEGWTAFAVLTATAWNKLGDRVKRLTPQTLESASALIRERLTALETVLPHSLQLSPWTQSGDVEVLRERYFGLKERLESIVPNLDRLLFTLPGS